MKFNFHPVMRTPLSKHEKVLEVVAAAGVAVSIVLLLLNWGSIPEKIPSHFGPSGKPDAWGDKGLLVSMPVVAAALFLVLTALCRVPHLFNYPWQITVENARTQYRLARTAFAWIKVQDVWLLVYIEWQMIQVAIGRSLGLGLWLLPVFIVGQLGVLGVLLYLGWKAR